LSNRLVKDIDGVGGLSTFKQDLSDLIGDKKFGDTTYKLQEVAGGTLEEALAQATISLHAAHPYVDPGPLAMTLFQNVFGNQSGLAIEKLKVPNLLDRLNIFLQSLSPDEWAQVRTLLFETWGIGHLDQGDPLIPLDFILQLYEGRPDLQERLLNF